MTAYLGKPGKMQVLPPVMRDSTADPSRGETVHALSGGGVAVTRRLNAKRTWVLPYAGLTNAQSTVLRAFYLGLFDDPVTTDFVYVDPLVSNVLSVDASATGARSQADDDWVGSTGTVATSSTIVSPVTAAGVLTWSGMSAAAYLTVGTVPATANVARAPVYLPNEYATFSVYVQASAPGSMTLRWRGYDMTGNATTGTTLNQAIAVTASWQRFSVTLAPNAAGWAGTPLLRPFLLVGSTAPDSVSITAAQVEYAPTASVWQPGHGSPRVLISQPIGRTVPQIGWADHTLALAER